MLPIFRSVTSTLTRRSAGFLIGAGRLPTTDGTRSFGLLRNQLRCKNPGSSTGAEGTHDALGEMIKPTDFQKKVLVWGKIYKSIDEVPERVSASRMKKARDLFRIRVNILMGICTLAGCIIMIQVGRRMRDSGDSLDARGKAQMAEWARKGAEEREGHQGK